MFNVCLTYGADQPNKTDWAKSATISTKNSMLFELVVANKGSSDFYVQIFDLAAAPSGSEVPEYDLPVPAGSFLPFGWAGGRKFGTGIYVRAVTAQAGSTLIASDDAKFTWAQMQGPLS